jgi:hypothetical protein
MTDEIQTPDPTKVVDMPNQGNEDEPKMAFGVHIAMMEDGSFGIQATGEPNLGEMFMLLSRATKSVEARMVAETVFQLQEQARSQQRIITPGR